MNVSLPGEPFILPVPERENSGVDFLGLRQVNLDLMALLLPGINNVTLYVRPFTLLAWIHWKFHELCSREGLTDPSARDLRLFRERIEVLFTWGARLENTPRIPGKDAAPPATKGKVELTFDAWGRVQSSTSLIAALWYGPASKTVGGLGFLDPAGSGFFRTSGCGVQLATALDLLLRSNRAVYARVLDTLAPVEADERTAAALWKLWGVWETKQAEKRAFRAALFSEASVGNYGTPMGRRSSTIALARYYLGRVEKRISSEDIRGGMFFASLAGRKGGLPGALMPAHVRWVLLQVRQLQRLALEAMLAWCETQILSGVKTSDAICEHASEAVRSYHPDILKRGTIVAALASYDARFPDANAYLSLARKESSLSPFGLMAEILDLLRDGDKRVIGTAFHALLLCASVAACFADQAAPELGLGGAARISLADLRRGLTALAGLSVNKAIEHVLETMVLSQHFATAVNRYDGQSQRLRFSIEETGLESLVPRPWRPNVTEDRLLTALDLSAECGIILKPGDDLYQFKI